MKLQSEKIRFVIPAVLITVVLLAILLSNRTTSNFSELLPANTSILISFKDPAAFENTAAGFNFWKNDIAEHAPRQVIDECLDDICKELPEIHPSDLGDILGRHVAGTSFAFAVMRTSKVNEEIAFLARNPHIKDVNDLNLVSGIIFSQDNDIPDLNVFAAPSESSTKSVYATFIKGTLVLSSSRQAILRIIRVDEKKTASLASHKPFIKTAQDNSDDKICFLYISPTDYNIYPKTGALSLSFSKHGTMLTAEGNSECLEKITDNKIVPEESIFIEETTQFILECCWEGTKRHSVYAEASLLPILENDLQIRNNSFACRAKIKDTESGKNIECIFVEAQGNGLAKANKQLSELNYLIEFSESEASQLLVVRDMNGVENFACIYNDAYGVFLTQTKSEAQWLEKNSDKILNPDYIQNSDKEYLARVNLDVSALPIFTKFSGLIDTGSRFVIKFHEQEPGLLSFTGNTITPVNKEDKGILMNFVSILFYIIGIPVAAIFSVLGLFIASMLILAAYYYVTAAFSGNMYAKTVPEPAEFSPAMRHMLGLDKGGDKKDTANPDGPAAKM